MRQMCVVVGAALLLALVGCSTSPRLVPEPAASPVSLPTAVQTIPHWINQPCPSMGQAARTSSGGLIVCTAGPGHDLRWHAS